MLKYIEETQNPVTVARCSSIRFTNVSLMIDGHKFISNINCVLENTGKTVVLGPNGAGKSLFLRLLAGLIEPTSGHIEIGNGRTHAKASQTLVFQHPVLLRRSTFENMSFVLRPQKLPRKKVTELVMQALAAAQLEAQAKTPARRLSGGEQQRLALARALIVEPEVLLLDEPTASLDPASTFVVEAMIDAADAKGTKIIFVTHDIRQAKRLADDIVFIHNGALMVQNQAHEFFRDPECREAQAYLDGRMAI